MKILLTAGRARRSQNGWALLVTMSIATAGMISLAGVMNWAAGNSTIAARNNEYFQTAYAAEAATEKALAALSTDFQNYNLGMVAQHVNNYEAMIPTSSDDPTGRNYWTNYTFGSGSNTGTMIVNETMSQTTNVLGPPYAGLKMVGVTYEIIANAQKKNSPCNPPIETTVGQAINIGTIPLFQFTVFYQNDMEVNPGAAMNIGGLVHGNAQIYTGVGGGNLTYSNSVTAVNNVNTNQSPLDPSVRSAPSVTFQTPFASQQNPINLPVGTNMAGSGVNSAANVYAILQVPNSTQGPGTAVGTNMLYNQADLIVLVSNNSITVQTGPMAGTAINVASNVFTNFITTNAFTDQREGMQMDGVVLNVSNLNNWVSTNQALYTSLGHELDSVYVADERGTSNLVVTNVPVLPSAFSTHYPSPAGSFVAPPYTNSQSYTVSTNPSAGTYLGVKIHNSNGTYTANFITGYTYTNIVTQTNWVQTSQPAVYLTNGAFLPSNGLSIATPDPAYVVGNWNVKTSKTGASDAGQNNTSDSLPSGIYADAVTVLSGSWNPNNSASSISSRAASTDTVNAAILTGNVPSNGSYYSGGVENFLRFLEDWSGQTLYYNGSLVCMFPSQIATGHWPGTGTVYNPPTRDWCFDQNFNNPNKMPPLMPQTRAVVRGRWATLPPGSTSF